MTDFVKNESGNIGEIKDMLNELIDICLCDDDNDDEKLLKGECVIECDMNKLCDDSAGKQIGGSLIVNPFVQMMELLNKKNISELDFSLTGKKVEEEPDNFVLIDPDVKVEDLGVDVKSLDDLIGLGNLYQTIVDKEKTDKEKKLKENKTGLYELYGKYYSVNLEVLNKLMTPLHKLNGMVGLKKIKESIMEMILYFMQNFEKKNKSMLHTIIEGPPGTGKTEIGMILAEIYACMGITKSAKFRKVKRTELIGEFVGHSSHRTQKIIDEVEGGVLFIDEAYSLGSTDGKDSFSKECIDVLNQNLSENKNNFVCIIAGYKDELETCFFKYNPGLHRRFPFKYTIDGYTCDELKDIFTKKISDMKWKLGADVNINKFFNDNIHEFPNYGGDIDNLILFCRFCHSKRIFSKNPNMRMILTAKDIESGLKKYLDNKSDKNKFDKENLNMYS